MKEISIARGNSLLFLASIIHLGWNTILPTTYAHRVIIRIDIAHIHWQATHNTGRAVRHWIFNTFNLQFNKNEQKRKFKFPISNLTFSFLLKNRPKLDLIPFFFCAATASRFVVGVWSIFIELMLFKCRNDSWLPCRELNGDE